MTAPALVPAPASTPELTLVVRGVGLFAPGLPDWDAGRAVLAGRAPYAAAAAAPPPPDGLPANERRRAPPSIRLAFVAAHQAIIAAGVPAAGLASVFASSDADTGIIQRVCQALARAPRLVSPTDFHNSVHNAAAGYWTIAGDARGPSTSLSAWDASLAAGLLEAASMALEGFDTLLAVYDMAAPAPMVTKRPIHQHFACALVLGAPDAAGAGGGLARLRLRLGGAAATQPLTPCADAGLEQLRLGNPAARALPLLALLAGERAGAVVLPAPGGQRLAVDVAPAAAED